jgi:hypothetical protein
MNNVNKTVKKIYTGLWLECLFFGIAWLLIVATKYGLIECTLDFLGTCRFIQLNIAPFIYINLALIISLTVIFVVRKIRNEIISELESSIIMVSWILILFVPVLFISRVMM